MKTHSVPTASGSISYRKAGTGPVLVLLHAFPLDSEMWTSQIQAFSSRFRVIAPDVPGFGGSAGSANLTIDRIATGMRDLLDALEIGEPIVLGGLSMGGYAALAFARLFPERLRALILADTKADPDDNAARAGRDKMIELVQKDGVQPVLEQVLPKLLGSHTQSGKPKIVQQVREIAGRQSTAAIASVLAALRDRPDARPFLKLIHVPTLVVVGEEDAITPPMKAFELCDGIPGAKIFTVATAGHLSNLENEAEFNRAINSFSTELNLSRA